MGFLVEQAVADHGVEQGAGLLKAEVEAALEQGDGGLALAADQLDALDKEIAVLGAAADHGGRDGGRERWRGVVGLAGVAEVGRVADGVGGGGLGQVAGGDALGSGLLRGGAGDGE